MPTTEVNVYQEENGTAPLWDWMDMVPRKVQDKFTRRIEVLADKGYDLRRPVCDFLRDGIYELRVRRSHVNYRVLYGFVGQNVVLLSHGCTKEKDVPEKEIDLAIDNLARYMKNPRAHTYVE